MGVVWPRRALYRARQFGQALVASRMPLSAAERSRVRAQLSPAAWTLFRTMPASDQRHSLKVMEALWQGGDRQRALLQAALLHDCAKRPGGVRLWHRVAMVLLRALRPAQLARWAAAPAPPRRDWRYPFWAHLNHPALGAQMAAAAGCDPFAVQLIRQHQDRVSAPGLEGRLLAALQAADGKH